MEPTTTFDRVAEMFRDAFAVCIDGTLTFMGNVEETSTGICFEFDEQGVEILLPRKHNEEVKIDAFGTTCTINVFKYGDDDEPEEMEVQFLTFMKP
jgi:hypothetical protein